jgi:hypothetical protein
VQQAARAAPEMPDRFAMTRRPIRSGLCAGRRRLLGGGRRQLAALSCRKPERRAAALGRAIGFVR